MVELCQGRDLSQHKVFIVVSWIISTIYDPSQNLEHHYDKQSHYIIIGPRRDMSNCIISVLDFYDKDSTKNEHSENHGEINIQSKV